MNISYPTRHSLSLSSHSIQQKFTALSEQRRSRNQANSIRQHYNICGSYPIPMLIVLPFFTVLIVYLNLLGLQKVGPGKLTGCRVALLQTVLVVGVYVAIQSEIFSLLHLLTTQFVAGAWLLALLFSAW